MKRCVRMSVVALTATVLFPLGLAAEEPVNVLSNGGFEEGIAGWEPDPQHSLVRDKAESHSGEACLSGEVTAPKRALTLRRRAAVKAGNRYEFEIWARGTNRTKLVLWAVKPGQKQRQMIAAWKGLPKQWRRYSTPISVAADGVLELNIIAPSSHAAPAGKIWIDDVALMETEMPPLVSVTDDVGFNDEPTMTSTGDGSLYVAWTSFRDGIDSLQLARYSTEGKRLARQGSWTIAGGEGVYILDPRLVPAGDSVVLFYAAETDKQWNIHAVRCGADGPISNTPITSGASVDIKPAGAWNAKTGAICLAWESNRNGNRQIFAAELRDGELSEATAVSPADMNAYGPDTCSLASGEVCVAWHGFADSNYDVYLRRKPARGSWGPERRLTQAPTIDRHPYLFARGDDLWLAYENALVKEYRIGTTNTRRLIVAKVDAEGLQTFPGDGKSPLQGRCEAASAAFDTSGRLWIAYLKPRLPRSGWDTFVTCYDGQTWLEPRPVSTLKGMDRRPSLVLAGNRGIVAFQADDLPNSWSDVDRAMEAKSNVCLASLDLPPGTQTAAMKLEPLAEPDEPFEAGQLRVERGEDRPTPSIEYQGRTLKLFFGDLHTHTDVSVCNRLGDQSIDEAYQNRRDIARHDFACTTDHGYNLNPYLWAYTAKQVRVNDDPGRYLTFLGEEWTSTFEETSTEYPYGFYGHRNLILADPYFPRWWNARNRQTPAQVWEDLRKLNANFVHIPHQLADTGNVPTDWKYVDEEAQPVAEIFQIRGSYEYKGAPREAGRTTPAGWFLQDAWARGVVIGVIASPDHGGGYGKACVFAPELTREAILDAIRARHCYGTTAAKIFLDVRVNGHLMGEKIAEPAGGTVEVKATARCPAEIDRIEVCRNNCFIYTKQPAGPEASFTFIDREPVEGRSYYYVRVVQKDEELAWSSPVWFGAE